MTDTPEKTKESFIFGNAHAEEIVFPDLTSPGQSEFKMKPGDVLDLEDFFTPAKLKRSRSLKLALNEGWIKKCKSLSEKVPTSKNIMQSGEAPLNDFDMRLADELEKEAKEEERLRRGSVDTLGSRARAAKAAQGA